MPSQSKNRVNIHFKRVTSVSEEHSHAFENALKDCQSMCFFVLLQVGLSPGWEQDVVFGVFVK